MTIESTAVRLVLVAATAVLVAGCAGAGRYDYAVAAGSEVQLYQALRLPAGSARVHIQGGRVVSVAEINRYVVHCSFGLEKQGDEALVDTIEPGRFELVRRSRLGYRIGGATRDSIRVASRDTAWLAFGMVGRDDPLYLLYTELPLSSEEQPQVDDLTCRYFGDQYAYYGREYPTLGQINAALGDIAKIDSPDRGGMQDAGPTGAPRPAATALHKAGACCRTRELVGQRPVHRAVTGGSR